MSSPQPGPAPHDGDGDADNNLGQDLAVSDTSDEDSNSSTASAQTAPGQGNGASHDSNSSNDPNYPPSLPPSPQPPAIDADNAVNPDDDNDTDSNVSIWGDYVDHDLDNGDSATGSHIDFIPGHMSDEEEEINIEEFIQQQPMRMKKPKKMANDEKKLKTVQRLSFNKKPSTANKRPTVDQMIINALGFLNERNGSSLAAIKKYCETNYGIDAKKSSRRIRLFLLESVSNGSIIQTKGKGASGSFKLSPMAKQNEYRAAKKVAPFNSKSMSTAIDKADKVNKIAAAKSIDVNANVPKPNDDDDVAVSVKRGRGKAAAQPKPTAQSNAVAKPKVAAQSKVIAQPEAKSKTVAKKTNGSKGKQVAAADSDESESELAVIPAPKEAAAKFVEAKVAPKADAKRKVAQSVAVEPMKNVQAKPRPLSRRKPAVSVPSEEPEEPEEPMVANQPKAARANTVSRPRKAAVVSTPPNEPDVPEEQLVADKPKITKTRGGTRK